MSLKVYKISDYDHIAEQKQLESICNQLQDTEGYIIGNFNIESVEIDALLITQSGFTILEFKNWGGTIIAGENGDWTADGVVIAGGSGNKSPYKQAQINRSRVSKGLTRLLGIDVDVHDVNVHIIFWQDAKIDDSNISPTVKKWLHIYDNAHLKIGLSSFNSHNISPDIFASIPDKLHITQYELRNSDDTSWHDVSYSPNTIFQHYEELEKTLSLSDIRKVYRIYKNVLTQVLEQRLHNVKLQFASGLAAKIDYVLKENNANKTLRQYIQDTRNRLRYSHSEKDELLMQNRYIDLRNICLFVQKIYAVSIPQNLSVHFPTDTFIRQTSFVISNCLRVVVEAWNDEVIYATAEGFEEKIIIPYNGNLGYTTKDWSYLHSMLYVGEQLNLIHPRKKEKYTVPELIILNPDYLIDVSSIASCFEIYADHGYVNLIKRLKVATNTHATLLGNFASQLLDETIHSKNKTYQQGISDFVKKNAIAMATCPNLVSTNFHKEAQMQMQHIQASIHRGMAGFVQSFDVKNIILEPSFYCEMLGIQGRMDMLQLDYNVLVEQKSGKSKWPQPTHPNEEPKHNEPHYVQLLLYLAILHYVYNKSNDEIYAFLLYSKYPNGLIKEGPAPDLLFNAIKVRNQIALFDLLYTQGNNLEDLLSTLSPETINFKHVSGKLWENYTKPELSILVSSIQQASELEKAYYFRMLKFVQAEQIHAKIGANGRNDSGQAAIWNNSLEEKKQAGNIYDNLTLRTPQLNDDGVSELILDYIEDDAYDMANFRKGDIVVLYSYNKAEEPNACQTMVFRATIVDIQTTCIIIKLRFPQSDPHVFERSQNEMWAIEHDFMESSFSSLYRGIHSFLSAPPKRRDLLLSQIEPTTDSSKTLQGEYGSFNDLVLRVKQANDLFLIIGPPGTGKTSFGLVNILKEELLMPTSSILLMSYTNRAVDEICDKLEKENIDYIRIGSEISCPKNYHKRLLENVVTQLSKISDIQDTIRAARVFVGTTTSINANNAIFTLKQFDLAIIDEASQILEPHLIGLLSAQDECRLAIRKFVLIGDHKQLPAVVQQSKQESKVADTDILQNIGLTNCANSLFERLLFRYRHNKSVVYMMTKQGRMHPEIAAFPNYEFYQNKLEVVPIDHQKKQYPRISDSSSGIEQILETRPISFIAVPTPTDTNSDKVNLLEADVIAAMVVATYKQRKDKFSVEETIGVIVPYRNQITTVLHAIDKYQIEQLHNITIDTIERYQGSQRDVIIYGFTIQKFYQLNFLTSNIIEEGGALIDRKLNVAMTRAKENLILVGNPQLLSENYTFYKLIEFIKTRQGYFDIPINQFVEGNFSIQPRICDETIPELNNEIYDLSDNYRQAFEQLVKQPIKCDQRTNWPTYILGNEWNTNRGLISYGRIDFRSNILSVSDWDKGCHINTVTTYTPKDQVLIYAFMIMRMHYCSAKAIYDSKKTYLSQLCQNYQNRMTMIDFGCGPATCAIALADVLSEKVTYYGIDVSNAMKELGLSFLENMGTKNIDSHFINSFGELDDSYWEYQSELPSLFVFNFSYFFSNVNAAFVEAVVKRILNVLQKYPLNKYLFIVQQSEGDNKLLSYKTFNKLLSDSTHTIITENSSFSYILGLESKNIDFYYTIRES